MLDSRLLRKARLRSRAGRSRERLRGASSMSGGTVCRYRQIRLNDRCLFLGGHSVVTPTGS
jgi:hypothetical protein